MQQFLLALCGLPASGKTTLAHKLANGIHFETETAVISTDDWRDSEYYEDFKPENEQLVRKKALDATRNRLEREFSVIHDDTNYYTSMRHELLEIAREFECIFGIIYVSTDLSDAIKWNKERDSIIPEQVIRRIDDRFDTPGSKYAWDEPLYSVDMANDVIETAVAEISNILVTLYPETDSPDGIKYDNPIDVATRNFVGDFLAEHKEMRNKSRAVSDIRKSVVRRALIHGLSRNKALEELSRELHSLLEN